MFITVINHLKLGRVTFDLFYGCIFWAGLNFLFSLFLLGLLFGLTLFQRTESLEVTLLSTIVTRRAASKINNWLVLSSFSVLLLLWSLFIEFRILLSIISSHPRDFSQILNKVAWAFFLPFILLFLIISILNRSLCWLLDKIRINLSHPSIKLFPEFSLRGRSVKSL